MPVRAIITEGTTADCAKADELTRGVRTKYLVADKGYDSDEIADMARKRKMIPIIPSKVNRKTPRILYKNLYKKRHKVENTFMKMKQWRGIATRYAKNLASFEAAVHICFIMIWGKVL